MSIFKVVIIVVLVGIILFGLMLYLALSPTIRDVSDQEVFHAFVDKQLTVQRPAYIYYCEGAEFSFLQHSLREEDEYPCERRYEIAAGTQITIHEFKTYKNASSGFTHVFAIGSIQLAAAQTIKFEYDWGSTDLQELAGKSPALPRAIWQRDDESLTKMTD